MSETTNDILKREIDLLLSDILEAYERSGKKVSGQFAEGLGATYKDNEATIHGYLYMAGRGPTKSRQKSSPTLRERIEEWIKQRGIVPYGNISVSSLAYIIARQIHKEGTNKEGWYRIYQEVITPERVDQIINSVAQFNLNKLLSQVSAELEILRTNV